MSKNDIRGILEKNMMMYKELVLDGRSQELRANLSRTNSAERVRQIFNEIYGEIASDMQKRHIDAVNKYGEKILKMYEDRKLKVDKGLVGLRQELYILGYLLCIPGIKKVVNPTPEMKVAAKKFKAELDRRVAEKRAIQNEAVLEQSCARVKQFYENISRVILNDLTNFDLEDEKSFDDIEAMFFALYSSLTGEQASKLDALSTKREGHDVSSHICENGSICDFEILLLNMMEVVEEV